MTIQKEERAFALRRAPACFYFGVVANGICVPVTRNALVRAAILPNNFWVNPTFELGSNLDQTDGTVSNWNRGGSDPTICQVITNNSVVQAIRWPSSIPSLAIFTASGIPTSPQRPCQRRRHLGYPVV